MFYPESPIYVQRIEHLVRELHVLLCCWVLPGWRWGLDYSTKILHQNAITYSVIARSVVTYMSPQTVAFSGADHRSTLPLNLRSVSHTGAHLVKAKEDYNLKVALYGVMTVHVECTCAPLHPNMPTLIWLG